MFLTAPALDQEALVSELANESVSLHLRAASTEHRGTAAGGAGGMGKHSEGVR
jgi:hypothetical protein